MKHEELRINNIVQTFGKFPMFVTGIFGDGDVYLDFNNNQGGIWEEKDKDLKPYIIDEKLLKKIGAKLIPRDLPCYDIGGIFITLSEGRWIESVNNLDLTELHKLQNYYYAIKGEDLEVWKWI